MIAMFVFGFCAGAAAMLKPGAGFRDLFTNRDRDHEYYSILFNVILNY